MKQLAVAVMCLFTALGFAQTLPQDTQQQEQIQRDMQQRIQEEMRQRELENATRPPSLDMSTEAPAMPEVADEGYCTMVNVIEYSGNAVFSNSTIDKALAPYIDQCLTITKINEMLQDIANLYIGAGYTTSRAYMATEQPRIGDGVLEIKIFEGMVNEVVLNGISRSEKFFAMPDIAGEVFYLRDVEQGVEQMNRLSSNSVTMNIVPTEDRLGYSDVVLENTVGDTTSIGATLDNLGSEGSGIWRMGLNLSQDNLMNINDQITLGYNRALEGDGNSNSNSFTFGLSIPFRYLTFNNYFSYSDYLTSYILRQSGERLYSLGDSYNNIISAEYLISRGQKHKVSISAGYTYKRSENFMRVLDVTLRNDVSSRSLSIVHAELPMTFYMPRGVLYFKPSYHKGVSLFGSLDDNDWDYTQKAQYTAWKGYAYYSHSFSKLNMMLTADGQYSGDELYSSEGFSIGGEGSVRGFKEESTTGDKGIVLKAELSANLGMLSGKEFMKPYKISAFYDWGSISSNAEYIDSVKLAGAGMSLSANYKYFNASITYAAALSKPSTFTETTSVYFRTGVNYSF